MTSVSRHPLRTVLAVAVLVFTVTFCFNAVSRADWTRQGECPEVSTAELIDCE